MFIDNFRRGTKQWVLLNQAFKLEISRITLTANLKHKWIRKKLIKSRQRNCEITPSFGLIKQYSYWVEHMQEENCLLWKKKREILSSIFTMFTVNIKKSLVLYIFCKTLFNMPQQILGSNFWDKKSQAHFSKFLGPVHIWPPQDFELSGSSSFSNSNYYGRTARNVHAMVSSALFRCRYCEDWIVQSLLLCFLLPWPGHVEAKLHATTYEGIRQLILII